MTTPALPGFFQPVYLDATDSTNDEAKRRARSGAPEGTLIWAGAQSAGRGRQGKSWFSPPGNLYLSLVLRPRCDVAQAAQLSFAAALAVGDACRGLLPAGAGLAYKWPNDVLVSGKKVAGILLESQAAGGKTLVLLTRLYNNLPSVPGRLYTQPSRRIELSQFDITNPGGIRAAYELGVKDGNTFAASFGR